MSKLETYIRLIGGFITLAIVIAFPAAAQALMIMLIVLSILNFKKEEEDLL